MTLDEAIKRYTDNAKYESTHGNLQGCLDFKQLVEWLKELQKCNTILDELKDEIKRAFDDLTESEKYGEDDSYTEYNRGCVWGLLHSYEMFGREYGEVNVDAAND